MTPLSYEDAYAQTNPDAPESQREASALALQNGVLANEIYWSQHTDVVTALQAQAAGHGQVVRNTGDEVPEAEVVESGTAPEELPAGETDPTKGADSAQSQPARPPGLAPDPSPENPNAAIAALRKQLADHGIAPEA